MKANILQMGDSYTGKTRALITLLAEYEDERGKTNSGCGLITAGIGFEANFQVAWGRNTCREKTSSPLDKIHWVYVPQAAPDWQTARSWAVLAQELSIEDLTKKQDPKRTNFTGLKDSYTHCANFVCQGCGLELGAVDTWTEDYIFFLEGMTGLNEVAKSVICGNSPFLSQSKIYGIQGLIWNFLKLVWGGTTCSTIINGHEERETDPDTGQSAMRLLSIGQKLAPRIVREVDEVIHTYRNQHGKYLWSTDEDDYKLKQRRMPLGRDLEPTFKLLFKPD